MTVAERKTRTAPPAGDGDDGTGQDAPAETPATPLPPATSTAAPLEPRPVHKPPAPPPSPARAPATAAHAAPRHVAIIDEAGDEVGEDDIFEPGEPHQTFLTARGRVYQKHLFPGTQTPATRLLYAKGTRVPRDQAETLKAQLRAARAAGEEAAAPAG